MKLKLSAMAVLAVLAAGLGFAPAHATAAIGGGAGMARTVADTRAAIAEPVAEQVSDRRYRERRGDYRDRRHYRERHHYREGRRHWRDDRVDPYDRRGRWERHNHRRHYRERPNIYFHFGMASPRYVEPRYVQPRYVHPRRTVVRLTQAHYNWCHSRYRSYRAGDNSFKPHHGPRRQCISPYS